jgi:NAD(P)-dependent dehydrogenase (short-subunit alcohol dehydrogenase family)
MTSRGQHERFEKRVGTRNGHVVWDRRRVWRGDIVAFNEMPREIVTNMIALNVAALTTLTHAALPRMLARGSGTIINVASAGLGAGEHRDPGHRREPAFQQARGPLWLPLDFAHHDEHLGVDISD